MPTQLAAMLAGVTEATIRKWASRGKLTRYGRPGRAEYDIDELYALVVEREEQQHDVTIADNCHFRNAPPSAAAISAHSGQFFIPDCAHSPCPEEFTLESCLTRSRRSVTLFLGLARPK